MELSTWFSFFLAAWLISVSPGPGALYAMSCGSQYGFRRGYLGTIGLISGIWTALFLIAIGASALIASSATAFKWLTIFGAAYLAYLGIRLCLSVPSAHIPEQANSPSQGFSYAAILAKGWVINATNPKGIVFMLAVMPQFIAPEKPLLPQYCIIGLTLAFTDAVVMACYTGLATQLMRALNSPKKQRWFNGFTGGLFVVAGLALVFKNSSSH
ncbi:MAG: hypothetical protein RLZZ502_39 [Pseudomonadota bacterium]|jgi:homoserine/homoserine lactone efflux protein